MPDRTFIYVDGESHFIRSENAWRSLHGVEACLENLRYIGQTDDNLIVVNSKAKVFWTRKMNPGVHRAYYFTSAVGDEAVLHSIKVTLRSFELEPCVFPELQQQARQRKNVLETQQLIEKAKGVDIALAVRMMEDSLGAFDVCHLYTSDSDFLPVIRAVRARGKQVYVHGYKAGLSSRSGLLHECDLFIDLEQMLRNECELIDQSEFNRMKG